MSGRGEKERAEKPSAQPSESRSENEKVAPNASARCGKMWKHVVFCLRGCQLLTGENLVSGSPVSYKCHHGKLHGAVNLGRLSTCSFPGSLSNIVAYMSRASSNPLPFFFPFHYEGGLLTARVSSIVETWSWPATTTWRLSSKESDRGTEATISVCICASSTLCEFIVYTRDYLLRLSNLRLLNDKMAEM